MDPQKKVLIILGSPRKNGNSTLLAQKLAEGVKTAGGVPELVTLQDLKIAPCNACDGCLKNPQKRCVVNDDMQSLYPKIKSADALVFATPTYWFNMSAQMKTFIDRSYALQSGGNYAFTGKKIGVILTYADVDVFASGGVNVLRSFQDICTFVKTTLVGIVHCSADKPGDVTKSPSIMQAAFDLGKSLAV